MSMKSFESKISKMMERYVSIWTTLLVLVITIWASFATFDLVEYAVINGVYGASAWDSGLRVIDNKGHLSDGRELSGFHKRVLYTGSGLLTVPFFLGSAFGFTYLNMRLHGKRLRDLPSDDASDAAPDRAGPAGALQ
jgi:hypothetical protein